MPFTLATRLDKPSLNVSIPPRQREAFFQALIELRTEEGDPLMSASAVVVRAIIQLAAEHRQRRPSATEEESDA